MGSILRPREHPLGRQGRWRPLAQKEIGGCGLLLVRSYDAQLLLISTFSLATPPPQGQEAARRGLRQPVLAFLCCRWGT